MNEIEQILTEQNVNYYSVYDKNGRKICDTSTLEDAIMVSSFGQNRTYRKNKILLDQVFNVSYIKMADDKQLKAQNILPDRTAEPFVV